MSRYRWMVPSPHGNRNRYISGCRCARCKASHRRYMQEYRARVANGETRPRPSSVALVGPLPPVLETNTAAGAPGPVEAAVAAEVAGLPAAVSRPGLVACALVLGRLLDGRAVSPKPQAARQLARLLDQLHTGRGAVVVWN
jgi:hypothetical protein